MRLKMEHKNNFWLVLITLAILHLALRSSAASAGGRGGNYSNSNKSHANSTSIGASSGALGQNNGSAPSTTPRRSVGNRVRSTSSSTTTSTPTSTTLNPSDRDVFNLLEMALESIDSKLRRVDSMDRSLDQLLRRIDALDARLAASHNAIFTQMSSLESRFLESYHTVSSTSQDSLEPQLLALDEKVSVMSSKLNILSDQIDNNLLFKDGDTIALDASETSTKCVSPPGLTTAGTSTHPAEVETLKSTVTSMDRHLKVFIDTLGDQMTRLISLVSDVQSAVIAPDHYEYATTSTTSTTTAPTAANSTQFPARGSKLDVLFHKMSPLLDVSEKMDEVWNVLVGTKSSVDTLVPTSEALLWQTQRQERAITDIHTDLNMKTKQIIENLGMVERHLTQHTKMVDSGIGSGTSTAKQPAVKTTPSASHYHPGEEHQQTLESQYQPTYKNQPEAVNITGRGVRVQVQELAKIVAVDGDLINLPTDLMDSEFLQDDAAVVNIKPAVAASSSTSSPVASTGFKIPPPTSMAPTNNSPPPPPPPDALYARSISRGANAGIIFPSVKNKPVVSNATFVYDAASQDIRGYSCAELKEQGLTKSGIYYLLIRGTTFWYLKVYCDMETENGGWTVIQRRDDYGELRENFNRDWDDYKSGFGDPTKEFWLGNENIFMLTNAEDYSLRVELEDFEGNKRYAEYSSFKLYSEREQYKLEIGGYTGNAGDSLNDPWYGSNLSPFSTFNRDNDRSSLNCASMLKGGWWWKSCGRGLNGIYLTDPQDLTARQGIVWFRWRGWDYTLKRASMMIRPRHYGKDKEATPTPSLAL